MYMHIQPARDEIQAPNTTDRHIYTTNIHILKAVSQRRQMAQAPNTTKKYIHIQQMHIYSRLPLSVKGPKLRTTGLVDAAAVILHTHNKQLEIYRVTNS